jgi:hypothetical protein
MIEMVERTYVQGVPKHRLPEARSLDYNPSASAIFVVAWADFVKMSSEAIQDVFRHRHILVQNTPQEPLEFDEAGLESLAPLQQKCQFQGASPLSISCFNLIIIWLVQLLSGAR